MKSRRILGYANRNYVCLTSQSGQMCPVESIIQHLDKSGCLTGRAGYTHSGVRSRVAGRWRTICLVNLRFLLQGALRFHRMATVKFDTNISIRTGRKPSLLRKLPRLAEGDAIDGIVDLLRS